MYNIREITPEMTYELRHAVLRPHQSINECIYDTDTKEGTFHVGAFSNNNLISIASFNIEKHSCFNSPKQYHLRAMGTLTSYRNTGAGRAVIQFAEEKINKMNYEIIWCNGRTGVLGYYERLGFRPYGEIFDYPGLGPHILMYKILGL